MGSAALSYDMTLFPIVGQPGSCNGSIDPNQLLTIREQRLTNLTFVRNGIEPTTLTVIQLEEAPDGPGSV